MDESFVVLSSGGGSGGVSPRGGATSASPDAAASGAMGAGVSSRLSQLELLFDFVEAEGEIDAPLCPQCSGVLRRELEAAAAEAEADADEYEAAVAALEAQQRDEGAAQRARASATEAGDARTQLDAAADAGTSGMQRVNRASSSSSTTSTSSSVQNSPTADDDASSSTLAPDERWQRRVARLRVQLKAVEEENAALDAAEKELDAMEDRYWQEYNDYMFKLQRHKHLRDGVLARIDSASAALETLRATNVFNDAFHIWRDGPYGTISGFRLGRVGQSAGAGLTSSAPVEWDEINAAWGQCVLLLSTLASACEFTFTTYRLVPMGSYSKVIDERRATLELFGPISSLNPFKRTNFDRAMVGYLRCLEELAEFASMTDRAALETNTGAGADSDSAKKPFALPYPIEGDKISGKTIKLTFNREDKWTAALKLMLADLKSLLIWVGGNDNADGEPM